MDWNQISPWFGILIIRINDYPQGNNALNPSSLNFFHLEVYRRLIAILSNRELSDEVVHVLCINNKLTLNDVSKIHFLTEIRKTRTVNHIETVH